MKKIALLLVGMLAAASAGAQNYENNMNNNYENYIQVTGKAEREIVPDEIYVRIVIDEQNLKNRQSFQQLEQDMIAKLKALGIDTDKDLKIEGMSSSYKDYLLSKNNPKTAATYQLKVNGASQLGTVFQTLESIGISNMSIMRLSHSRIKEIQDEIRVEALQNAKALAEVLAGAYNQTIGRAVYIMDYNNDAYIPVADARNDVMYARGSAASTYETELDFKNIKINYTLTVKFELY